MTPTPHQDRARRLAALRQTPQVPVLIIGGGINGVGLLRELALQGVAALLVERDDFCAGASAASSRMIHGGLRYLENGEFRLVRESVQERNRLLQNAPHYVRPLPTTIPIFNWTSGTFSAVARFLGRATPPVNRGALLVKAGLTLYDLYTRQQRLMPPHRFRLRAASRQRYPDLHPGIVCTATYYDAWISYAERLGLELVLDAEAAGATALNHVTVSGAAGAEVTLRDEISGELFTVRPQIVVNATGAWIDLVNGTLGRPTAFIGGTKGSHLVLNHPGLRATIGDEMIFYENADGRICIMFAIEGKVLAGSTDIRIDDPDNAICTPAEIDYILDSIRQVFPGLEISPAHIDFHFCGVRPLPNAATQTTGQISRDHHIEITEAGGGLDFPVLSLVGGKWTTFRAFAAQVADVLLARIETPRRTDTAAIAIGGGQNYPPTPEARARWSTDLAAQTGLTAARIDTLLARYGTRAAAVARYTCAGTDAPLQHQPDYTRREVDFITRHEMALRLDDLVLRRTMLAFTGALTPALLVELAAIMGAALGWTDAEQQAEIDRTRRLLATRHGVNLDQTERQTHHA